MRKADCRFSGIFYELKCRYPFLVQFCRGMETVKRELNRGREKKDRC
ncbi:MAG: hypothetical protein K2H34_10325 [Lachnospiraceae bacterium]|nr:hypothetical protein [Lachnospiraceae bacterium]